MSSCFATTTITPIDTRHTRGFPGWRPVCLILYISVALAALQNVTVDDATLSGAVVPQYLPIGPSWSQGANCTPCLAKPDPSLAYNGTWHDTTFYPGSNVTQSVQFTFIGSAVYIYFILANTLNGVSTFTDVAFILDGATVGTYTHIPSTGADYLYNVSVYANESLDFAEHNMMIQPIDSNNQTVLVLFDYFIYTIERDSANLPSSSATQGGSSKQNIGAIVGGTVAGVAALMLATVLLLWYRRNKRRNITQIPPAGEATLTPFSPLSVTPVLFKSTSQPTRRKGSPLAEGDSVSRANASPSDSQSPDPFSSSVATPSAASSNSGLLEQVGLLREEVAHLRQLHHPDRSIFGLESSAPPEYSETIP